MQKITLWANQEEQVQRWMNEPTKSILCGSEQDTGKTGCTVEFALRMEFSRVLVIGIKDAFDDWRDRVLAQSDQWADLRRIDATKKGQVAMADYIAGKAGWFFIGQQYLTAKDWGYKTDKNGELVTKRTRKMEKGVETWIDAKIPERIHTWRDVNPELIVYDEVHMAANSATKTWKTLNGLLCEWKLALSGTWYGNKFENAHGPTRWLWPDRIAASPYVWRKEWCATKTQYIAGGKTVDVVTGEKFPGEFVKTLPCYTALLNEDEVPDPEIIHVDLTPQQRKAYTELEMNMMTYFGDHPYIVEFPVALRMRLRTATLAMPSVNPDTGEIYFEDDASSSKLDSLYKVIENRWAGQNVFIASDSKVFAQFAARRLRARGHKAMAYSGDESSKQRAEIKRMWLEGEIQYIVATSAASTGLDGLQRVCNKLVWMSKFDSAITNQQFVKRIFRTGELKDGFEHVYISANKTYDDGQFASLELQAAAMKMSTRKS